jgi:manganese/zinc/iron transport system substrate-binding protein
MGITNRLRNLLGKGMGWIGVLMLGHAEPCEAAKVRVTTTTTMITDLVKQVGGDRVAVSGLMGPGVDPHLYKATAADLRKLQQAQVIFYSGLHLEGKMQEVFENLKRGSRIIVAITDAIPRARVIHSSQGGGEGHDPHVWFEVPIWTLCIDEVLRGLQKVDPEGRSYYEEQASALRARMGILHEWCVSQSETVPIERRILVTSHDAFSYFGRAYGFKVVALQGISTVTEAGLADVTRLVDFVKQNKIKAVFVESSVPPAAMQRIQKDSGAVIGGELFSDATGTPGEMQDGYDLGSYEGMIRHNMKVIVAALR